MKIVTLRLERRYHRFANYSSLVNELERWKHRSIMNTVIFARRKTCFLNYLKLQILRSFSNSPNTTIRKNSHIIYSPHVPVEQKVGCTIPEILRSRSGLNNGNKSVFECAFTGRKYSYNDILMKSCRFAGGLLKLGHRKGDVVAIVLPNIPEYAVALFGIWDAGLVATTINPNYTKDEIQKQLNKSQAKSIITTPEYLPIVNSLRNANSSIQNVISVGKSKFEEVHNFFEILKMEIPIKDIFSPGENDLALLLFSSGTTGSPKGVMLTHENISTNFLQICRPGVCNVNISGEQERFIGSLPFFHSYGIDMFIYLAMHRSAHTLCLPKYDFNSFLQAIRKHKPTVLHLVPQIIQRLSTEKSICAPDLDSLHTIISAATTINLIDISNLMERSEKYFHVQNCYGMTEIGHCTSVIVGDTTTTNNNNKIKSVGNLLPSTKAKIVDLHSGRALPSFQTGEIYVQGKQTFKGYLNDDEATRETITPDNWVKTGDVGYYDDEGCIYIVDRVKDIIKVKGYQVSPSELEEHLTSHPKIAEAAIVGIPNEYSEQLPRAFIVRKEISHSPISEKEVHYFMNQKLAPYKQLKGGIEFVQEIPKAASGKILRRFLLESYLKRI